MSLLILTLPLADDAGPPEYRYTLSHDGHQVAQHGRASAALLPATGRAAGELIALVPVQALSWQRVQLPPGVAPGSLRMRARLDEIQRKGQYSNYVPMTKDFYYQMWKEQILLWK